MLYMYIKQQLQSPPVTDTRNVLLKCRHSVLSIIGYNAAAGHVVLLECHNSVLSMIRPERLQQSHEFSLSKYKHALNLQVPDIDTTMDWLTQHPTDQCTHSPKNAGNTLIHACEFSCPIYSYFLRITLSSSLPFVTHIQGHMARTPLPSQLPSVPSF